LKGGNFGDFVHVPRYVSDSGGKGGKEEDGDAVMKGVGKGDVSL